jgi:serine/threonine-protein kinase
MYYDLHTSYGVPLTVLTPKSQEDTVVISPAGENKNLISSFTSVVFNKVKSQKKDTKVPVYYTGFAVIALSILGLAGGFYVTQQMLGAQERVAQLEKEKKEAEDKKEIAEKERLIAQQKTLEAENLRQAAERQRLSAQNRQAEEKQRRLAAESRQAELERQRTAAKRRPPKNSPQISQTDGTIVGKPGYKNIRSGPGTTYNIIGSADIGDPVKILGSSYDSDNYQWYQVYHPNSGTTGWIAAQLINVD